MIAWKLTTKFDKERHLFFEKIETDYIVETYICSCGHTDFITKYPEQKLKYVCKECENTKFYNVNNAWRNIEYFLYQNFDLEFSYEYDIQSDDDMISSLYITSIPKSINFANRKVIYSKKTVYSLALTINGELKENYSLRFEQKILSQLKNNLTQYINENSCFNIPVSIEKDLNLSIARFFLKNKHLKDFDFYYWEHIEKVKEKDLRIKDALENLANIHKSRSVKKAIYQNYTAQLYDTGKFNSTFIEVFCKTIKDLNILTKLINLKIGYSIYSNLDKDKLYKIMHFLKKYYSEKQLLKLYDSEEFNANNYLFIDAVRELNYNIENVKNNFKKVSCKVQSLHDEFVRCSKEERYKEMKNKRLTYSEEELKACVAQDTYHVKLPKDGKELFDWSEALHNCMAQYFEMIQNSKTIIYGFFQENILVFAVEICDDKVVQASSKYNIFLDEEQQDILDKWFGLFFINKERLSHVA